MIAQQNNNGVDHDIRSIPNALLVGKYLNT